MEGEPITDASLIRLRFEHQTEDLGKSELRITPNDHPDQKQGGVYHIKGSNLSAPGAWKVRLTIERPDQYDTVVDFAPTVAAQPQASPAPVVADQPIPQRIPILVLTGTAALLLGFVFLLIGGVRRMRRTGILATGLLALGIIFLLTAWRQA